MARIPKQGFDYFPHDTDASNDDKLLAVESLYGNDAYAVYFKLLERIYRSDDGAIDVSAEIQRRVLANCVHLELGIFEKIMTDIVAVGLFDQNMYENDHKITSEGVIKRREFLMKNRERVRKYRADHADGEGGKEDTSKYKKGKFASLVKGGDES